MDGVEQTVSFISFIEFTHFISVNNWRKFNEDFKEALKVQLTLNYRSTKCIVDACNQLIVKNENRQKNQPLEAVSTENGQRIRIVYCEKMMYIQAEYVADLIEQLVQDQSYSYKDIAVLYRINRLGKKIEYVRNLSNVRIREVPGDTSQKS